MIGKKSEDINESYLKSLIEDCVQEGKTIEYKTSLNLKNEKGKLEFLKNVSSFANASGGNLIYGIKEGFGEKKGFPVEIIGMPIASTDTENQRIESIIRSGISPRLPSLPLKNIHWVPLCNNHKALVIRICKSWIGPHRVVFSSHDKFYTRNSSGKHSMDVSELRIAFTLSDTIIEKVRKFKENRILNIIADETPFPLNENPKIVLHLIPLISFNPGQRYDIVSLRNKKDCLPKIGGDSHSGRYNLDGYLSFEGSSNSPSPYSYTQFFKNGIIEGVDTLVFIEEKSLIGKGFEGAIIKFLNDCLIILNELTVEPPFVVFLTLVGVKGYEIEFNPLHRSINREAFKIDRDVLIIPEVLLEGFDDSPPKVLKPIFDSVWNACGFSRSFSYDDNGEFKTNGR